MKLTRALSKLRWDSSDPERYPPPLPLPPALSDPQTTPHASAKIQAAANRLHEKAREAFMNISPNSSPERSLVKGAAHRRMQSAATSGVDLKTYLEGIKSTSPERPSGAAAEYYSPTNRPETPTRKGPKPILGENTPPSATMRALQSAPVREDIFLQESTNTRKVSSQNENVSAQLVKLTTIATNLQQEMSQLSRRSKDNAADLIDLKQATKSRDDDLRRNIKEIMSSPSLRGGSSPHLPRSTGMFGLGLLDNKPHISHDSVPRAASHNNIFDADRIGSPSPYSVEGVASVAMLEKIIREMVTKEGQERLLSNLSELCDKSSKMSGDALTKVNELADFIKDKSNEQALANNSGVTLARTLASEDVLPFDLRTMLTKIRDSVASSGGLTAEVKALIKELRGEILGMGRELGRKLDLADPTSVSSNNSPEHLPHDKVQQIVNDSMLELRNHMEQIIQESARQSSAMVQSRALPSEDTYTIVKHALKEHSASLAQNSEQSNFDKLELVAAVRSACESFKPEIELQQYGLERDEVLDVLKEGLAQYRPLRDIDTDALVNKQEIFDALNEALQSIQLPQPMFDIHTVKAEMLASIRQCLEDFHRQKVDSVDDLSREFIHDAIRTGLSEQAVHTSRVMEINKDDLFDAVKAGLDSSNISADGFGGQVVQQLHSLVDSMKIEFQQYSAANGRDTEQVLDAIRDGFEGLTLQIETMTNNPLTIPESGEAVESVRSLINNLRGEIREYAERNPANDHEPVVDCIRSEFEKLQFVIGSQHINSRDLNDLDSGDDGIKSVKDEIGHLRSTLAPILIKFAAGQDRDETLDLIKEALAETKAQNNNPSPEFLEAIHGEFVNLQNSISQNGGSRSGDQEMLDTIRLGLDDLRSHVDKKIDVPDKHIFQGEMLDTLTEGLESLKGDVLKTLDKPVDMTVTYEILDTLKEGLAGLRESVDKLTSGGSRTTTPKGGEIILADTSDLYDNLGGDMTAPHHNVKILGLDRMEVLLGQLHIKVEAMDKNIQDIPPSSFSQGVQSDSGISQDQIANVENILKEMQLALLNMAEKNKVEGVATKADTDAIETLLRNTKSYIEELDLSLAQHTATKDQVDAVEAVTRVTKDSVDALTAKMDDTFATRADMVVVGELAVGLKTAIDDLTKMSRPDVEGEESRHLTKADLDVLGIMCTEIKNKVTDMVLPDVDSLPHKADIEQLHGLVTDLRESHGKFKETYDQDIAVTAKAFDDRRNDTEQVVTSVSTAVGLMQELRQEVAGRESDHNAMVDQLNDSLNVIAERMEQQPTLVAELKDFIESLRSSVSNKLEELDDTNDQHHTNNLAKQIENRDTIVLEITNKLETFLREFSNEQVKAQRMADARIVEHNAVLTSTREMADDLRLSVDTLGTALTASTTGFNDATEKLNQDSKTVFNRVEDVFNKIDETQMGLKGEHDTTRQHIVKAIDGVANIQNDLLEHNPKILVSLQSLQALVGLHYEHSQKTSAEHIEALKLLSELNGSRNVVDGFPQIKDVESIPHANVDQSLHEKLDKLVEKNSSGLDPGLVDKLEKLTSDTNNSSVQVERLDAIHAQMMATAAEVTAFVASQTQRIADEHSSREKEAEELTSLLDRYQIKKEHLEDNISTLKSEEDDLKAVIQALQAEKEAMTAKKLLLTADLQSLQTAIEIRKEEMTSMAGKADLIEQRIMEGLMNHSRALLLTKTHKPTPRPSPKKPKGRDLRMPSGKSQRDITPVYIDTDINNPPTAIIPAILNYKPSRQSIKNTSASKDRRFMSLSQINPNAAPSSPSARQSLVNVNSLIAAPRTTVFDSLKRSQSVRSSGLLLNPRKSSWNAGLKPAFNPMTKISDYPDRDKENDSPFPEDDEELSTPKQILKPSTKSVDHIWSFDDDESKSQYSDTYVDFSEFSSSCGSHNGRRHSIISCTAAGTELSMTESGVASLIAGAIRDKLSRTIDTSDDDDHFDDASSVADSRVVGRESTVGTIGDENNSRINSKALVTLSQNDLKLDTTGGVHYIDYATQHHLSMLDGVGKGYITPGDSGIGSDLPTADLEVLRGGFFPSK